MRPSASLAQRRQHAPLVGGAVDRVGFLLRTANWQIKH